MKAAKTSAKLGSIIDEMAHCEKEMDFHASEVSIWRLRRTSLEAKLLTLFSKQRIEGSKGRFAQANIAEHKFPSIKDRRKFLKYVRANNAYDLFQNRITPKAYFDRLEEGEEVPGVEVFTKKSIRITKRRK